MNWSLFFGELVSGLTLGSIYALIALGYTMVYGILKLLNFAHGDVYMVGAFVGFFVLQWLGGRWTRWSTAGSRSRSCSRWRWWAAACSGSESSASPTGRYGTHLGSRR